MEMQKEKSDCLKPREQVIKEILVDEFETDDSMREINYNDINSN